MAYTVAQLIADSYNMSGIVSRGFETVEGEQESDGLIALNDVIGEKTVDTGMIPFFQLYEFFGVEGQEEYFIPGLVAISTLTFFLNNVRYSTQEVGRDLYFGAPRAENIESLVFNWHLENKLNGSALFLYFKPDQTYRFNIWGKFSLINVAYNQDLEASLPRFYITYLKFVLAERLCINYSYPVPPGISSHIATLEEQIDKNSGPLDLTINYISTLDNSVSGVNYAQVNLGKGWTAPS
jgi:hypothetical protein